MSLAFRCRGWSSRLIKRTSWVRNSYLSTILPAHSFDPTLDSFVGTMNKDQDLSYKAISCRTTIDDAISRRKYSPMAAMSLSQLMVCSLLISSGLEDNLTVQFNFAGDSGFKNIMTIADSTMSIRGYVSNPLFEPSADNSLHNVTQLLGNGEIQVVKNHPLWKHPMNGIIPLTETDIATSMALYMSMSEQRTGVFIVDVDIKDNKCHHAYGLFVEALPGVSDDNLNEAIARTQSLQKLGLNKLVLDNLKDEDKLKMYPEECVHTILDHCVFGGEGTLRWTKNPKYFCPCSMERVLRTVSLMTTNELEEAFSNNRNIEVNCGFCGQCYQVMPPQIKTIIEEKGASTTSEKP